MRIVEAIDVIGSVVSCELSILVDLFLDPLLLQAAEEGLGDGIIPTVVFPAHARLEAMAAAEASLGVTAALRALIGMNHRAARTSPAYAIPKRIVCRLVRRTGEHDLRAIAAPDGR